MKTQQAAEGFNFHPKWILRRTQVGISNPSIITLRIQITAQLESPTAIFSGSRLIVWITEWRIAFIPHLKSNSLPATAVTCWIQLELLLCENTRPAGWFPLQISAAPHLWAEAWLMNLLAPPDGSCHNNAPRQFILVSSIHQWVVCGTSYRCFPRTGCEFWCNSCCVSCHQGGIWKIYSAAWHGDSRLRIPALA